MHLLHLSIGSSDTTLANPIHVPSLSLPAFPILRCKLHVRIRSFILHFLQTIFFPTVPPLLLVYSAAHALLTPVSLDFHIGIPLAANGTTSYPLGRLCPTVIAKVNRFCLCHTIYTICLLRNSAHVIAAATATLSDSEVGCPTG